MRGLRLGHQILNRRPLALLRNCLGIDPKSRLGVTSEACDRCIVTRTAYVVVAHP